MDNTNGSLEGLQVTDGGSNNSTDRIVIVPMTRQRLGQLAEILAAVNKHYKSCKSRGCGRRSNKRERELFSALKAVGFDDYEA